MKRLIRSLVLSRSYQLSSKFDRAAAAQDPENRWLWRMSRRRLQVEVLRDGLLSHQRTARSVAGSNPLLPTLRSRPRAWGSNRISTVRSVRRTVYLPVIRNDLPALLQLFDFGDSLSVNGRRSTTNRGAAGTIHDEQSAGPRGGERARPKSFWQAAMLPDEHQVLERLTCASWDVRRAPTKSSRRWRWFSGHVGVGGVRIGGRSVGESPGVGDAQPSTVLFDEFPVSRLRRAAMFESQPIGISRRALLKNAGLRFRISGLRGARFAGRRGRTKPAAALNRRTFPRGPSG